MSKKVKVPSNMTQAELFGVSELGKVKYDNRGVGRLPDPYPENEMLVFSQGKWRSNCEEQYRRFIEKCSANGSYSHPSASPLPWHLDFTSADIPVVFDANNVEVFRFDGDDDEDMEFTNALLIIACVNKFAASISEDDLEKMNNKRLYGDENCNESNSIKGEA